MLSRPFTKEDRDELNRRYIINKKGIYYCDSRGYTCGRVYSTSIKIGRSRFIYDSVQQCFLGLSKDMAFYNSEERTNRIKRFAVCDICNKPLTDEYEIKIGAANHEACWKKWVVEQRGDSSGNFGRNKIKAF